MLKVRFGYFYSSKLYIKGFCAPVEILMVNNKKNVNTAMLNFWFMYI